MAISRKIPFKGCPKRKEKRPGEDSSGKRGGGFWNKALKTGKYVRPKKKRGCRCQKNSINGRENVASQKTAGKD